MSDQIPPDLVIPQAPQIEFSAQEARYLIHIIDFHKPHIQSFMESMNTADEALIAMAFLMGAIETQMPETRASFDQVRRFFDTVYPAFLEADRAKYGEEGIDTSENLMIVWPAPLPDHLAIDTTADEPRLIQSGNRKVN